MTAYRKKPVVIEAIQWHKHGDHPAVVALPVDHPIELHAIDPSAFGWVTTLEGGHVVTPGDWIITGVKGEHYPCKPDIFAATYELAHPAHEGGEDGELPELPELPEKGYLGDDASYGYDEEDMRTYARQALASRSQPAATPPDAGVREALESARQFIKNGVEFGYIRMPDRETPDSAHDTLPLIERALAALSTPPAAASAAVPKGWKLVPVDPTMEMRSRSGTHHVAAENIYRAMLAAAPAAQPAKDIYGRPMSAAAVVPIIQQAQPAEVDIQAEVNWLRGQIETMPDDTFAKMYKPAQVAQAAPVDALPELHRDVLLKIADETSLARDCYRSGSVESTCREGADITDEVLAFGRAVARAAQALVRATPRAEVKPLTAERRERLRQEMLKAIDERIPAIKANHASWRNWPGTWAIADCAVSVLAAHGIGTQPEGDAR